MMRKVFFYGVYASLLFLGVTLYRTDFFNLPRIFSINSLVVSLLLLFSGYVVSGLAWHKLLHICQYPVSIKTAVSSSGLSIFGKYIPGKIWVVLGRAAYIKERYEYPLHQLSSLSLQAQFIMIWIGLVLGATGLFLFKGLHQWGGALLALGIVLSFLVFTPSVKHGVERSIELLFRKKITLPNIQFKKTLLLLPWFITTWIFWSLGFYFFVSSIMEQQLSVSLAFGFPLSVSFGIVAVFVPGGLGVREGVMVAYLMLAGLSLQDATSISIAARLWALFGEVFIFVLALLLAKSDSGHDGPQ